VKPWESQKYKEVSIISGTGAAIYTAFVVVRLQEWIVILAYLESQCTKCHAAGWSPCFSTSFYLELYVAHVQEVAVKRHHNTRTWLFGLPGGIHFEQSPWRQRKWWACSWIYCSPVCPASVSVGLDCSIGKIVTLSQGYNRKSSLVTNENPGQESCIVVPLSDPSRNRIRPDTRLQIKGRNKSAWPPSCVKFCSLTPKIY
jgi:hypothetical protein